MSFTNTIQFEVHFPGLRDADRDALYKKLWGAAEDMTRASNRLSSVMLQMRLGHIKPPRKENGEEVSPMTLVYQAFSGKWRPTERPIYEPYKDNPRASSGVLNATSAVVLTRIKHDGNEILRGSKSLATFRMPLCYKATDCKLRADGAIVLTTFAGRNNNTITARPVKLDRSRNEILRKCREGVYKAGDCNLKWHKRKGSPGRWMFSMAWTNPDGGAGTFVPYIPGTDILAEPVIAGVDTGITHAAWVVFCKSSGEPLKRPEIVQFPNRTLRAVARLATERKQRAEYNRKDLGLRAGHGITRKLRVNAKIADKIANTNDTMIRQIAASVISKCKLRGATVIALEDHRGFTEKMHARADGRRRSDAAYIRGNYFRWHQGAMREALKQAALREGLTPIEINPAWTSRTCHRCGLVWKRDWIKKPFKADVDQVANHFGRVEYRRFTCSCGYVGHADHNAAVNIARRGIDQLNGVKKKIEAEPLPDDEGPAK